jgi:hypothetical protein
MPGRDIGVMRITLSSDIQRQSAGTKLPGEGTKVSPFSSEDNWIPIYRFAFDSFSPEPDTLQAVAKNPINQRPVRIHKLMSNATGPLFQAATQKSGIYCVEFKMLKSTGADAQTTGMVILGQNGMITRWSSETEIVQGLNDQGVYNETTVQWEIVEILCTQWYFQNNAKDKGDKKTQGAYDFQNPKGTVTPRGDLNT